MIETIIEALSYHGRLQAEVEKEKIMKEIVDEKNNKIMGNVNLDNSKVKFIGSNNVLYINDEIKARIEEYYSIYGAQKKSSI